MGKRRIKSLRSKEHQGNPITAREKSPVEKAILPFECTFLT